LLLVFYLESSETLKNSYKAQYETDPQMKAIWDLSQSQVSLLGLAAMQLP